MTPGLQVFLSGTLTFGVPLVLATRELLTLRRGGARRSHGRGWEDQFVPPPPPPIGPQATGRKALPACFIPVMSRPPGAAARTVRTLELT